MQFTSSKLNGVIDAPPLLIDMHIELHSVRNSHSLHSHLVGTQLESIMARLVVKTSVFSVANRQLSYAHPFNLNDL